jgi:hypothetical protein
VIRVDRGRFRFSQGVLDHEDIEQARTEALCAFAAIAMQSAPQRADAAPNARRPTRRKCSLALRMALSMEGVECQPK